MGLRTRIALAFAVAGLLLSMVISLATLGLTRQNLLQDHYNTSFTVFINNARRVLNELTSETDDEGRRSIIERLGQTSGGFSLLQVGEAWTATDPRIFGRESVPASLQQLADKGTVARIRSKLGDTTATMSALPIRSGSVQATYFEAAPLNDIEDTLETLFAILLSLVLLSVLLSALLGFWAARKLLRPLLKVSKAAEALATGNLNTRLDTPGDSDLDPLATSFNEMAGALQNRIARDAQFASAVSHELRSPLMTLTASVEVITNSASRLDERGRTALKLLTDDIARFHTMVENLLEINRYDVGAVDLRAEPVNVTEFVQQAISGHQQHIDLVTSVETAGTILWADKRRLQQVLLNLIDNATKYGKGEIRVILEHEADCMLLSVEDDGPGVLQEERQVIFDRFNRGQVGIRRGHSSGSGLGLALVEEHVRLHDGKVWVEDRGDGKPGSRFVVKLPISKSITAKLLAT